MAKKDPWEDILNIPKIDIATDAQEEGAPKKLEPQAKKANKPISAGNFKAQALEIQKRRMQGAGRPAGAKSGQRKERPTRCTFILPSNILEQLHIIATLEGEMYKETIERMAREFIRKWEEDNGHSVPNFKISDKPKK